MALIIILLVVETLILLATMPIRIQVKGYFSLDRQNGGIDVKVFALTVVRVRFERESGKTVLKLNGKPIEARHIKRKESIKKQLRNAVQQAKLGNIRLKSSVLAVFGDAEPKNCAVIWGIVESVLHILKAKGNIYADYDRERMDVQFRLLTKLSIVQAIEIAA